MKPFLMRNRTSATGLRAYFRLYIRIHVAHSKQNHITIRSNVSLFLVTSVLHATTCGERWSSLPPFLPSFWFLMHFYFLRSIYILLDVFNAFTSFLLLPFRISRNAPSETSAAGQAPKLKDGSLRFSNASCGGNSREHFERNRCLPTQMLLCILLKRSNFKNPRWEVLPGSGKARTKRSRSYEMSTTIGKTCHKPWNNVESSLVGGC